MKILYWQVSAAVSCLLISFVATADTQIEDAKEALNQLRQQQAVEFGYERHSRFDDRTMLELHQPQVKEQPWQLLQENAETPSAHRLDEYRRMKRDEEAASETTDEEQQSVKLSLTTLVQEQTLQYLDQRQWQGQTLRAYSFEPNLEKFSEHNDKLQGHLYLSVDSEQLKGLSITLQESFSPAMSVKLERFKLQIELMQIEREGKTYTVPQRTEEQVAGSYLYFKDFDDYTVREYSDYQVFPKPASDK
ncbi:hypothetical protein [Idiomarina seosinensis]|uniref:Uncharacterized protein n=1 Tax=Idiomarina seosinensis TaxID=281739 RepID=A0A432ZHI3_9GAMM|nr:hypothetical protein [Idiomarina seosinensis]RUO77431.1 hypothetical protein CWI81_02825 [Idiomarina seosinensis]